MHNEKIGKILSKIYLKMKKFIINEILIPIVPFKSMKYIEKYFKTIELISQKKSLLKYRFWLVYFILKQFNFIIIQNISETELKNLLFLNYFSMFKIPNGYIYLSAYIIFQCFYYYRFMHLKAYKKGLTKYSHEILILNNNKLFLKPTFYRKPICQTIVTFGLLVLNAGQVTILITGKTFHLSNCL